MLQKISTFKIAAFAHATKASLGNSNMALKRLLSLSIKPASSRTSLFLLNTRERLSDIRMGIRDWRSIARFLAPPVRGY